jgi:putative lipoic acid-binding regulatory protein
LSGYIAIILSFLAFYFCSAYFLYLVYYKEPQNIAVMEKFRDSDINAMSIIKDSIKDQLVPYISHSDSSKKMYDALTNLFSVRNIGQVMSLKNELCDMKMNDDDNITSYFVRIS